MLTDLLIVGAGPAGLACANMFARLRRPCTIYDSGLYRNASSPSAHTLLTHEGIDPAQYRTAAWEELGMYPWVTRKFGRIVALDPKVAVGREAHTGDDGSGFVAKDDAGGVVEARKVVLATGLKDILPPIPGQRFLSGLHPVSTRSLLGLAEAWGKRAIHCVFCHGTETASSSFGVLLQPGNPMNGRVLEGVLTMWGHMDHSRVYVFTNGGEAEGAYVAVMARRG